MTGQLLEVARARFLAAGQAWFNVEVMGQVTAIERARVYLLKPTGLPQLATAMPAPWDTVIGVIFEQGNTPGAAVRYRALVGLEALRGLSVLD